jgi:nitric oxide synthase oxygenase domain/subunit
VQKAGANQSAITGVSVKSTIEMAEDEMIHEIELHSVKDEIRKTNSYVWTFSKPLTRSKLSWMNEYSHRGFVILILSCSWALLLPAERFCF